MILKGIIRGNTIELLNPPALPDGTRVEVELRPLAKPRPNPFWGLLREHSNLLDTLEEELLEARAQTGWRLENGESTD